MLERPGKSKSSKNKEEPTGNWRSLKSSESNSSRIMARMACIPNLYNFSMPINLLLYNVTLLVPKIVSLRHQT